MFGVTIVIVQFLIRSEGPHSFQSCTSGYILLQYLPESQIDHSLIIHHARNSQGWETEGQTFDEGEQIIKAKLQYIVLLGNSPIENFVAL